jgi:hypothetical protein
MDSKMNAVLYRVALSRRSHLHSFHLNCYGDHELFEAVRLSLSLIRCELNIRSRYCEGLLRRNRVSAEDPRPTNA